MRIRTRTPLIVIIATLALLTVACSDGSDDPGVATLGDGEAAASPSSAPDQQDVEEALLAWAECMRDHGVDVPDPQVGPDGDVTIQIGDDGEPDPGDGGEVDAAFEACREKMPNGGEPPERDPEQEAAMRDAQLEFARCMNDHGVEVPEPTGDAGGFAIGGPGSGIAPSDPDVQAALEECQPILEEAMPSLEGGE